MISLHLRSQPGMPMALAIVVKYQQWLCLYFCKIVWDCLIHNGKMFIFKFPYGSQWAQGPLPLILLQRILHQTCSTLRMKEELPKDLQYDKSFMCIFKTTTICFQLRYNIIVTVSMFSFFNHKNLWCTTTFYCLYTNFRSNFWKAAVEMSC